MSNATSPATPMAKAPPAPMVLPVLTGAFAVSVAIWVVWFLTHLPWVQAAEQFSLSLLLVVWMVGTAVFAGRGLQGRLFPSALMGLTTAAIGLLLLGTKLTEHTGPDSDVASVRPNAAMMAGGFLVLGVVIGVVGGLLGRVLPLCRNVRGYEPLNSGDEDRAWLGRFALVTAVSIFPLLLIGGLVTSTNSGMAVPDWPNTYGSNMFLYPLGPRARPDVFLEHSHRLFGTFAGLSILVLAVLTLMYEPRRGMKVFACILLAYVVGQGLLGAARVLKDTRYYGLLHGVLGQVLFALTVIFAARMSGAFRTGDAQGVAEENPTSKRVRIFTAAAMHSTLLQLLFGAMYRHLRDSKGAGHALMMHMAFSLVVVVTASLAVIAATSLKSERRDPLVRSLACHGRALLVVLLIQFTLGWVTWSLGGKGFKPEHEWQAVLRTSHQANGAIMLGLIAWMWVLARRIPRLRRS